MQNGIEQLGDKVRKDGVAGIARTAKGNQKVDALVGRDFYNVLPTVVSSALDMSVTAIRLNPKFDLEHAEAIIKALNKIAITMAIIYRETKSNRTEVLQLFQDMLSPKSTEEKVAIDVFSKSILVSLSTVPMLIPEFGKTFDVSDEALTKQLSLFSTLQLLPDDLRRNTTSVLREIGEVPSIVDMSHVLKSVPSSLRAEIEKLTEQKD